MHRRTAFLLALSGVCSFMLLDQYLLRPLAEERRAQTQQVRTVRQARPHARDDGGPVSRHVPPPTAVPAGRASERAKAWLDDQVIVAPAPGESLAGLAREYGVPLLRLPGPSGYGAVGVPEGVAPIDFTRQLLADGRVTDAARNAITYGASTSRANPYQWHLDAADAPGAGESELAEWVVAVLDTGVAYESYGDAKGTYVKAPSFAGVSFVAPYDFINMDAHANDDHQHGTHIASCIASYGVMEGVAAGVTVMPVKVLDEHNSGTELALIDGIAHAVDHGADVINMSLSFGEAYKPPRPSSAL